MYLITNLLLKRSAGEVLDNDGPPKRSRLDEPGLEHLVPALQLGPSQEEQSNPPCTKASADNQLKIRTPDGSPAPGSSPAQGFNIMHPPPTPSGTGSKEYPLYIEHNEVSDIPSGVALGSVLQKTPTGRDSDADRDMVPHARYVFFGLKN